MSIDARALATIESILTTHPVVLFMKGTRYQPQCGFSAKAVGILDGLLPDYATINVLDDAQLREKIKDYGQWPTIPQLYVNGELIGGCDIVNEMFESGELHAALSLQPPTTTSPQVSFSDTALSFIRQALDQEPNSALHLQINARWEPRVSLGPSSAQAIQIHVSEIPVCMDANTAQRADGLHIDLVDSFQGHELSFEIPNAPPPVKSMSVTELKHRLDAGEALRLLDVRGDQERQLAEIAEAVLLDKAAEAHLKGLAKDTPLVFHCHIGQRSQSAAEHFRVLGFTVVYNLEGGIDAWSIEIDPDVPRY